MTPAIWLRRLLLRRGRTHRVTTITRTVTREKGEPEESREVTEEVVLPMEPERPAALHVSIAVTSVAALAMVAFLLGWLLRRMMD